LVSWEKDRRLAFVEDVMAGIGSAFSKNGLEQYENAMNEAVPT
jgi:hypothetical protein